MSKFTNGSLIVKISNMSLSSITLSLGLIGLIVSVYGIFFPSKVYYFVEKFPRNAFVGRILAAACCILAARESFAMNMAGLNVYKDLIYIIAPAIFVCSIIFLKELLLKQTIKKIFTIMIRFLMGLSKTNNFHY